MSITLEELRAKALALPQPYRLRALANVRDARKDAAIWPEWSKRIVTDCQAAIVCHEADAKEGQE
jgi:hypothetical protein